MTATLTPAAMSRCLSGAHDDGSDGEQSMQMRRVAMAAAVGAAVALTACGNGPPSIGGGGPGGAPGIGKAAASGLGTP
ncbi:MAG: hypothetical protein M3R48_07600, partial [Candidatus Dormibacteraeota bacterium]|nr:hypothetical protein [Candidatus Dormibacteraeota bacterium]